MNNKQIIGDLQVRCAQMQTALEQILELRDNEQAKEIADDCLGALAVVDKVTLEIPIWIGLELYGTDQTIKVCIGLNQDDGHDVSYTSNADIEHAGKEYCPWIYEGINAVVSYDPDARVFNDNHELIKPKQR